MPVGAQDGAGSRSHVEALAADALEGRLTGSEGERRAAEYISEQLIDIGASPLPGHDGFHLSFEFTAGVNDDGSTVEIQGGRRWTERDHVQALSFSDSAAVDGEVVFAGYGLVVPDSQDFGYDSYATLDVTDKIVVVLRYFPEDVDQELRGILSRYSGLRYKAMAARQRGATALLVLVGPRSPNAGQTVAMTFDTAPFLGRASSPPALVPASATRSSTMCPTARWRRYRPSSIRAILTWPASTSRICG